MPLEEAGAEKAFAAEKSIAAVRLAVITHGSLVYHFVMDQSGTIQWLSYLLLALAWVSQRRGSGNLTNDFGFSIRLQDAGYILLGMLLLLALGLAISPLAEFLGADETPQVTTEAISRATDLPTQIIIVLAVAVATPIVEELTFRGLLLRYLEERMTPRRALVISAGLFGMFHILGTNGSAGAIIALVQTFLAGLVLAYVTQKSGKLSRAIFVHGGFNLITILVLFFLPDLAL